ncbi:hypothetical protein E4U41_006623 [Claviceps citrina]|nr:hypothetical protein E4U41_006623 [Claviceps citrina]
MQYVRNLSDSVSIAWNSINPATLSGAIDVIVVEHDDGTLACSPFHVRFGKFSLLRPSEKKVEFKVNGVKQDYSMKLGEGGEAFFVFETTENVPESLQTSPLVSPASSPILGPQKAPSALGDPDLLDLDQDRTTSSSRPMPSVIQAQPDENGIITPLSTSPDVRKARPSSGDWRNILSRPRSEDLLRESARSLVRGDEVQDGFQHANESERSHSPLSMGMERAKTLAKELSAVNIPSRVTETGDLMLDMTGFKSSEEDMLQAEILARKILSEELEGNYDIGSLFGFDEEGNLWIYSSEEAKQAAMNKTIESSLKAHRHNTAADAVSDPGYQSDGSDVTSSPVVPSHRRSESDAGPSGLQTPPRTPLGSEGYAGNPNINYAKTLRLTSQQLKALDLRYGENSMSFTVNRATCSANMFLWKRETPVVISDIDGTITKSDALGHVLNMIGRDWTHTGIAKLYSDIAQNGYNIMYLTSRSVGQADTTRAYVNGVVQGGCRLPHGPTILSPDRTMAALRREVYLRQPHVFKMATLRDISSLYGPDHSPFYAGFGNRLTDQISYRTVDVPRTRIFTINSNSEVSLDLLSLNKLKMSYVNINEVVDHYFPPVATLVKGGGEDYTDFKFWRDEPLELDEFSASDSDEPDVPADNESTYTDDDEEEEEEEEEGETGDGLIDSYISHQSKDGSIDDDNVDEEEEDEYLDDEEGEYEEEEEEVENVTGPDDEEIQLASRLSEVHFSDKTVEEDVGAELITGIGQLSHQKKS